MRSINLQAFGSRRETVRYAGFPERATVGHAPWRGKKGLFLMEGHADQGTALNIARKCGVLIADDEPAIREVLDYGLQREGFAVWLAGDGEEAVDLYRGHHASIDVLLLDVRMPRLDGPQTLTLLQGLTPEIPCCFMSAYLGDYTEVGLRAQGARAVFKKPFHLLEVAQVLREAAQSAGSHVAQAAPRPSALRGSAGIMRAGRLHESPAERERLRGIHPKRR